MKTWKDEMLKIDYKDKSATPYWLMSVDIIVALKLLM